MQITKLTGTIICKEMKTNLYIYRICLGAKHSTGVLQVQKLKKFMYQINTSLSIQLVDKTLNFWIVGKRRLILK